MKLNFGFVISVIFSVWLFSCKTSNQSFDKTESFSNVNKKYNSEYKKSIKVINGTLNDTEYSELLTAIERELNIEIPNDKNILINFVQNAPNCIFLSSRESNISNYIKNTVEFSTKTTKNLNTIEYFIYSKDVYYSEYYRNNENFILDSGFFYDLIFNEHENCSAFLAIKTNGEFYKYYGEDYFSRVRSFLASK